MGSVKLAVSLPEPLYDRLQSMVEETNLPRSQVIATALHDYLRRREIEQLRARINAAYADGPDAEEQAMLKAHLRLHREALESEGR
ncbi:MAG: ribbon-helix-helix protein, CopG family [Chloroflexota bacterium]